jgi:hypothetical protein
MIREILFVSLQRVSFNLSEGCFYHYTFFSDQVDEPRRNFAERWTWGFLGHWKAPESNKQDIGEEIKRTPDRRPRKLRIDGVSRLAIVRVRGAILKNRSGVIGALNEASKNGERFE